MNENFWNTKNNKSDYQKVSNVNTLEIIKQVLVDAKTPLHYKEIAYRAYRDFGYDPGRWDMYRNVNAIVSSTNKEHFAKCGDGFWGLASRDKNLTDKQRMKMWEVWQNNKSEVISWLAQRENVELQKNDKSVYEKIIQVLTDAKMPLHFKEIAYRANRDFGYDPGRWDMFRNVNAIVSSTNKEHFTKCGGGFWGLASRDNNLTDRQKNKMWEVWQNNKSEVISWLAQRENDELQKYDKSVYKKIIHVLNDAKMPLHFKEISYRANINHGYDPGRWDMYRNVNAIVSSTNKEHFTKCGDGFWGLASRDNNLTDRQKNKMWEVWDTNKSKIHAWFQKREKDALAKELQEASELEFPESVDNKTEIESSNDETGMKLIQIIESHNEEVRDKLHQFLFQMDWKDFEDFVVILLKNMGYLITQKPQRVNDKGIDIRCIDSKGLAPTKFAIQVKRWDNNVSDPEINKIRGALNQGETGIIVTTSDFTKPAKQNARDQRKNGGEIHLINGGQLVEFLIQHRLFVKKRIEVLEFVPEQNSE